MDELLSKLFQGVSILPNADVSYLEEMMFTNGKLNSHPLSVLKEIPINHLRLFAGQKGIYQFITNELIDWLKEKIAGRKTIEICAGNGAIARHLGIPATDSYMQTTPEMMEYYRTIRQQPISPPSDVYKFEANDAVDHFKPEVVIGAWVTQKWQYGDKGGSVHGVDEILMFSKIKTYINIGNENTHSYKRIMSKFHSSYKFPWLVSRGKDQSLNYICVWERK